MLRQGHNIALLAGGIAPFNVLGITGLTLWLDATKITPQADATSLATWVSSDAAARSFAATGVNNANITYEVAERNGNAAVRLGAANLACFDNATAISTFITNSAYTIFCAGKIDTNDTADLGPPTNKHIVTDTGGYVGFGVYYNAPSIGIEGWDGNQDSVYLTADTAWHVWEGRHESGTLYFSQDGAGEVSVAHGNTQVVTGNIRIGSNYLNGNSFIGPIGEIIISNAAISSAERAAVRAYLKARWATP